MRYLFEDCVLDTDKRELRRRGEDPVSITPQVFDLLEYLILNRERVVSKDDLIDAIWKGRIVSDAAVTTRLNAARSAIGDSGEAQRLIKTLPRKGFRFVVAVQEMSEPSCVAQADAPEPPRPALALPEKPSVAVLPFVNLNGDPEHAYLADGIVEDVITELSRFSELFVIAWNSSFQYKGKAIDVRQVGRELGVRYVLQGSVRRGSDRIRISAQLIDAATGVHRWAERYDRTLEGVFAVQDDVVRTIVAILAAQVRMAETERTRAKPPSNWQAYDYYLQAADAYVAWLRTLAVEHIYEARRLLQRSLGIDPNYARSYAVLANTYMPVWYNQLDADFLNPSALDQAHRFARRAVEIDPNLPEAHAQLGFALMATSTRSCRGYTCQAASRKAHARLGEVQSRIDNKLRGRDLVALRVDDLASNTRCTWAQARPRRACSDSRRGSAICWCPAITLRGPRCATPSQYCMGSAGCCASNACPDVSRRGPCSEASRRAGCRRSASPVVRPVKTGVFSRK